MAALRWIAIGHMGGPGAPRPPDPVRAPCRTARAVGRVDADRGAAGRLRGALGGLQSRLALARNDETSRNQLRDHHPRRRHFLDRRCSARCEATLRRALSHTARDRDRGAPSESERQARRRRRHHRRACARARRVRARLRARGPGHSDTAHRCDDATQRRGRHDLRRARTGNEPLRIAARVRG